MAELPEGFEMGRASSGFLDEIRTVLSRAQTALRTVGEHPRWYTKFREHTWTEPDENGKSEYLGLQGGESVPHPGADEGIAALNDLVQALERFERTGSTKWRG